ncbi:AbrB/MazE/SpoVT family DNA-binding domain-containing protein [Candidatus Woesearchaeota archaeon]|nr:AbrB/MazE/SpoVT family DNA-binding domain-containing protein [Candidatus Woesearchaeota archaeon]
MTTTLQYARKVGGSLIVTIPQEIAVHENLHAGDMVKLQVEKAKKDWFGALKGAGGKLQKGEKVDIHE